MEISSFHRLCRHLQKPLTNSAEKVKQLLKCAWACAYVSKAHVFGQTMKRKFLHHNTLYVCMCSCPLPSHCCSYGFMVEKKCILLLLLLLLRQHLSRKTVWIRHKKDCRSCPLLYCVCSHKHTRMSSSYGLIRAGTFLAFWAFCVLF